ncbi:MAG: NYN domain-containing protein [Peptoniphilaceae bacterium]|nr:NYN domain-containing protein [Peptoniphilaceae bacterium]
MARTRKNILLVDGYNVINSWKELVKLKNHSFEDAREKLIEEMAEFSSLSAEEVTIVFDAYKSDYTKEVIERKLNVNIVFTKKFQTADSFIEREVDKLARKENVRVCSDDSQIQSLSLDRGATRLTASELKNELFNRRMNIKRKKRENQELFLKNFPMSKENIKKLDEIGKKIK